EREEAAAGLPALRHDEATASAELQRLVHARQQLEEEECRIEAARGAAEQRLTQLAADIALAETQAADARDALARLEAERDAATAAQAQEALALTEAGSALDAARADVAALEAELTRLTEEIAAAQARRDALARRKAEAEDRTRRLGERADELARQRQALEAESISAERTAAAAESVRMAAAEVDATRAAAEAAAEELRAAEAAETAARAPLELAERNRAKLRAEAQALTELLAAASDRRFAPVLDSIQVAQGYEAALGAALGDDLTAPADPGAPVHWHGLPDYDTLLPLPEGVEPLAGQVIAPALLRRRIGQIGIVEDAAQAEALQPLLRPGQRLVSRDGGLWRWDGFRRAAGTPSAAAQRLRQRNRLAEIEDALNAADREVEALARTLAEAQDATARRREAERNARENARHAVNMLAEARDREAKLAREAAQIASRLEAVMAAAERLVADLEEAKSDGAAATQAIAGLPDPALAREAADALKARLAERRTQQIACQGEFDRLRREAELRRQRLATCTGEIASWTQRAETAARQRMTLEERRAASLREREELERRPTEIAAQREALAETIARSTERRNAAADALAEGETRLAAAERTARAADAALAAEREERVRCEAHRDQAHEAQHTLARHIGERLECLPQGVLSAAGIDADETLPPLDDATRRLERLTRERDTMGPVNLVAETEAQEVEERLRVLTAERDDLIAAIAKLRQGIQTLNREGRERLLAAFEQVDKHFRTLFASLFGGGHAYLRLDYPEGGDPLEAGLEIMASPPDKKLQVLSLLSGGEQALTALALLFAVFLTHPAPICVLDEVDAPLDDANVDRFCRLAEEISETCGTRFLICTHHRLTMARVDRLFGVTMAEKGVSQLVSVDLQAAERLRRTA
ncbi:MAG TPA: chromosome partitioning protein ParA, partial [Stellaceae bacterium]|nr:chromosome partitioning protein ParA [Stellaceae bacterium]